MNYVLALKGHVENLTLVQGQGQVLTGHASYQSICIVVLNTSKLFSLLYLVYQELLPKKKMSVTFHDLKWSWGLVSWGGITCNNFPIQGVNSTWNPMFECSKGFRPKQALVHFLLMMERSQNWSDLKSRESKFWDIHFIDTVTCINRWKF